MKDRRSDDSCRRWDGILPIPLLFAAGAALLAGCGGAPPPQVSGGQQTITVTGAERLAWDQSSDEGDVQHYQYVVYVDNVRQHLAASCDAGGGNTQAQCAAPLPHMTAGAHRLELASVRTVAGLELESERSAALQLMVTASTASSAVRSSARNASAPGVAERDLPPRRPARNDARFVVETIAAGIILPSGIAVLPQNRVLVAEASGIVRLWHDGAFADQPAAMLPDIAQNGDVGLIDLTPHAPLARDGLVFVAYTARDSAGRLANRVLRFRLMGDALVAPAVLLDDPVDEVPRRTPRVRVGADGKLYVAFPAGQSQAEAEDPALYVGKILRLNEDGTTPSDNPGYSPIISQPHRAAGALAWDQRNGQLWLADRDWSNRDLLFEGVSSATAAYAFDSAVDPSAATFYTQDAIRGFAGSLLIAALDGQHIRRVQFDASGAVNATEKLLDGQFGRIADITVGPDGALYFCTSNSEPGAAAGSDKLLRLKAPD